MAKSIPGPTDAKRSPRNIQDGTTALTASPPPAITYSETVWDTRIQARYGVPSKDDVLKKATEFLVNWESVDEVPDWPGGQSGVTWGVGWDAGQHTVEELRADWAKLGDTVLKRLEKTIGKQGGEAETLTSKLDDIHISQELSLSVFKDKTLPDYHDQTTQAFPGLTALPLGIQVALISLVYNRGASTGTDSFSFDSRWEMRQIQRAVQQRDLLTIYQSIGSMIRLWKGTDIEKGMTNRRHAEQALVLPYVQPFLNGFRMMAPIA